MVIIIHHDNRSHPKNLPLFLFVDHCGNHDCHRRIGEAAPQTPLFYYHIPGFSGVTLPMAQFLQVDMKSMLTLLRLKFSSTGA